MPLQNVLKSSGEICVPSFPPKENEFTMSTVLQKSVSRFFGDVQNPFRSAFLSASIVFQKKYFDLLPFGFVVSSSSSPFFVSNETIIAALQQKKTSIAHSGMQIALFSVFRGFDRWQRTRLTGQLDKATAGSNRPNATGPRNEEEK